MNDEKFYRKAQKINSKINSIPKHMSLKDTSNVATYATNSFAFYPLHLRNVLTSIHCNQNNKSVIDKLFTEPKPNKDNKIDELTNDEKY